MKLIDNKAFYLYNKIVLNKNTKQKKGEKTMEKFKNKGERGITLIALVISIIVLLILAGVTIAA